MDTFIQWLPFENLNLYWVVLLQILLFLFVCAILKWLWNSTLTDLFSFKRISFWQAIKVVIISAILFGGGGSVISLSWTQSQSSTDDHATTIQLDTGEERKTTYSTNNDQTRKVRIGFP